MEEKLEEGKDKANVENMIMTNSVFSKFVQNVAKGILLILFEENEIHDQISKETKVFLASLMMYLCKTFQRGYHHKERHNMQSTLFLGFVIHNWSMYRMNPKEHEKLR